MDTIRSRLILKPQPFIYQGFFKFAKKVPNAGVLHTKRYPFTIITTTKGRGSSSVGVKLRFIQDDTLGEDIEIAVYAGEKMNE